MSCAHGHAPCTLYERKYAHRTSFSAAEVRRNACSDSVCVQFHAGKGVFLPYFLALISLFLLSSVFLCTHLSFLSFHLFTIALSVYHVLCTYSCAPIASLTTLLPLPFPSYLFVYLSFPISPSIAAVFLFPISIPLLFPHTCPFPSFPSPPLSLSLLPSFFLLSLCLYPFPHSCSSPSFPSPVLSHSLLPYFSSFSPLFPIPTRFPPFLPHLCLTPFYPPFLPSLLLSLHSPLHP